MVEESLFSYFWNLHYQFHGDLFFKFLNNSDFQKKRQSHKLFRKTLAYELVQPLLDKRAEGDVSLALDIWVLLMIEDLKENILQKVGIPKGGDV